MKIDPFFFRLYHQSRGTSPTFAGTCFPVTANGDLATCRHLVETDERTEIHVHDNLTGSSVLAENIDVYDRADIAILRGVVGSGRPYLPLLPPSLLQIGQDVFSYAFWQMAGTGDVDQGYFSGRIVSFSRSEGPSTTVSLVLPFPSIEGMSGAPVLTYHNGPKVVGLLYGNRSSRVLAHEIMEGREDGEPFEERIHRLVEFGLAHHVKELVLALGQLLGDDSWTMSDQAVDVDGLQ